MATLITRGIRGIINNKTFLNVRSLNKDGTLGKEFQLPNGTCFEVKQMDFYRKGLIATDINRKVDFFIPLNEYLETVQFLEKPENAVVDAICLYRTSGEPLTDTLKSLENSMRILTSTTLVCGGFAIILLLAMIFTR